MLWSIMNIAPLLGMGKVLSPRRNDSKKEAVPALSIQPPKVYSNLPQIEKVDFHTLFKKWED